jgi:TonB family protein
MRTRSIQLARHLSILTCLLFVTVSALNAQQDTVEFKYIPKYHHETDFTEVPPPEVTFKPVIVFPSDPKLQGRKAKVYVEVLVDTCGNVREAHVLKSTDGAFDKFALKYAKQYKFKVTDQARKFRQVGISIPIVFGH